MPVIPALGKLRQEDHKFKATLGYLFSKKKKNPKQQQNYSKSL
jgi:hypothetical protein